MRINSSAVTWATQVTQYQNDELAPRDGQVIIFFCGVKGNWFLSHLSSITVLHMQGTVTGTRRGEGKSSCSASKVDLVEIYY